MSQTQGPHGRVLYPAPDHHLVTQHLLLPPLRYKSQTALNLSFMYVGGEGVFLRALQEAVLGINSHLPSWKFLAKYLVPMTSEQMSASLGFRSHSGSTQLRAQVTQGRRQQEEQYSPWRVVQVSWGQQAPPALSVWGKSWVALCLGRGAGFMWVLSRQLPSNITRKEARPPLPVLSLVG